MNVVATADGQLVEVQGTGEEHSFSRAELDRMLDLAQAGIDRLTVIQNEALASLAGRGGGGAQPRPPLGAAQGRARPLGPAVTGLSSAA